MEEQIVLSEAVHGGDLHEGHREEVLSNVKTMDRWIVVDGFMQLRGLEPKLPAIVGTGKPFFFFTHNPLASGLFQLAILLNMQRGGLANLNAYRYVMAMAHLYNALRCENLISSPWQDMEDFIALHGQEYVINKKPLGGLKTHWSCLHLAARGSMQAFAKDTQGVGNFRKRSKKGARLIQPSAIIASFQDRLCPIDGVQQDIVVEKFEAYLSRRAEKEGKKHATHDPL